MNPSILVFTRSSSFVHSFAIRGTGNVPAKMVPVSREGREETGSSISKKFVNGGLTEERCNVLCFLLRFRPNAAKTLCSTWGVSEHKEISHPLVLWKRKSGPITSPYEHLCEAE